MAQLIINGTDYQIQDIIRGLSLRNSSIKQINWNIAEDSYTLDLPSRDEHDVPVVTPKRNPPKPKTSAAEQPVKGYKPKTCKSCGQEFIPHAGRQTKCDECLKALRLKKIADGDETASDKEDPR